MDEHDQDDPQGPAPRVPPPHAATPHVDGAGEPDAPALDPDDLAGVDTAMSRLGRAAKRWLAAAVAVALLLPAGAWIGDELGFLRSGEAVVATLDGTLEGVDVAGAVLLVRSAGCPGRTGTTGSAFVVATPDGPQLVTNRHVVEHAGSVGLRGLDGRSGPRVTGIRLANDADVAVLEVDDRAALPPALEIAGGTPAVGTAVRLVGFPAATPFTSAGEVADAAPGRLRLALQVDPGASGSPVVGDDGRVVAQVFAVDAEGFGIATPAAQVLAAAAGARDVPSC